MTGAIFLVPLPRALPIVTPYSSWYEVLRGSMSNDARQGSFASLVGQEKGFLAFAQVRDD